MHSLYYVQHHTSMIVYLGGIITPAPAPYTQSSKYEIPDSETEGLNLGWKGQVPIVSIYYTIRGAEKNVMGHPFGGPAVLLPPCTPAAGPSAARRRKPSRRSPWGSRRPRRSGEQLTSCYYYLPLLLLLAGTIAVAIYDGIELHSDS